MVYRDGLENRYGFKSIGGSNPSPSASLIMEIGYIFFYAALAGVFVFLWRKGHLNRLANYVAETREELRKCTWPTVDELKGSTVVVMVSIALISLFTVVVDLVVALVVRWITS